MPLSTQFSLEVQENSGFDLQGFTENIFCHHKSVQSWWVRRGREREGGEKKKQKRKQRDDKKKESGHTDGQERDRVY